jgi:plasmid maintenance system killer protein
MPSDHIQQNFADILHAIGLIEDDNVARLNPQAADMLQRILPYLAQMDGIETLKATAQRRPHRLKGDRKRIWSVTVAANGV